MIFRVLGNHLMIYFKLQIVNFKLSVVRSLRCEMDDRLFGTIFEVDLFEIFAVTVALSCLWHI